ncbi:hypothetical protein E8E11_004819 [Didymella keratinophila]|nr:hypothetical protein E8E11_004819 [Didymella keratinophila]
MQSKKDQLSETKMRRISHSHGIRFEGPVPPSKWPDRYKHTFQVIRAIQFLQYETYKKDARVDSGRRSEYRKKVQSIRTKVRSLLIDLNPNERAWRDLETPLFNMFDSPVLWYS